MIKKLSFKNVKTYGDMQDVLFDKIDEIAEVVNALTESKKEVTMLENRLSVLETNNNVAKTSCGGRDTTADGMFNKSTPWEPFREEEMTTITQSKDGLTTTVGKKETSFVINATSEQINCKITNYDIEHKIDNLKAIKTNITSLEVRNLKY